MAGKTKYTFESKIHVYRATKRMTQQELADLVGVSRQTIMQLERNRYNPSMMLAYSIAQVFDVTIEEDVYKRQDTEDYITQTLLTALFKFRFEG